MDSLVESLQKHLECKPQFNYPVQSRVHPLQSFQFPGMNCFVKREDELGFGISGSKIRKYRSLIPWLIINGFEEVAVIGSASSNHVLSISQLLIENNIKPTLFLRGDPSYSMKGNCVLSSLFIPSSSIYWFLKKEWHEVEIKAQEYASSQPHVVFVLPEGGCAPASLPGSLTLAVDIVRNEKEGGIAFDHIFIEAGTGFMASALILGLNWLKSYATVHVLLLADDEDSFYKRLRNCQEMFNDLFDLNEMLSPNPQNFLLHSPELTKGFGQTSPLVFQTIKQMAQEEGFLTDPVYSAKLFCEGKRILSSREFNGNILFIHSGGALTLMGFQDELRLSLED